MPRYYRIFIFNCPTHSNFAVCRKLARSPLRWLDENIPFCMKQKIELKPLRPIVFGYAFAPDFRRTMPAIFIMTRS